jgi:hypothetical protein
MSLPDISGLFFEHRRRIKILVTDVLSPKLGQFHVIPTFTGPGAHPS